LVRVAHPINVRLYVLASLEHGVVNAKCKYFRAKTRGTLYRLPNVCTRHIPDSRSGGDPHTTTVGGLIRFGILLGRRPRLET